jgi:adenylate kinase family enzyme
MRIILEGPDNAGKTTLAENIRKADPYLPYHHPGGRPANAEEEKACMVDQMRLLMKHPAILMDRCTAISQQVYTPKPELEEDRRTWLANIAKEDRVFIVFCRPSTDWLMSFDNFTWREGETEEFKQEIIDKQHVFIQRYDAIMATVPHVHFDYRSEEAPHVLRHLRLGILGRQESIEFLNKMVTRSRQCA